jgi:hypothetical protein
MPREVKGNGKVGWFFVLQNVQHHGNESMDCVGVLAVWCLEGIWA